MIRPPPITTLFPYTTLFRSSPKRDDAPEYAEIHDRIDEQINHETGVAGLIAGDQSQQRVARVRYRRICKRSEEHTSELQSHSDLVCRLLLEKKKHKRSQCYG